MSYVLVIEADALAADRAEEFLASLGHTVRVIQDRTAALCQISLCQPDAVLADLGQSGPGDGLLQVMCDGLAIPLMDLSATVGLLGNRRARSAGRLL